METDPLKARLKLREITNGKIPARDPDAASLCSVCSEGFCRILNEIEEKMSCFPEVSVIPVIKKSGYCSVPGWLEGLEDEKQKVNHSEEKAGKKNQS